MKVGSMAETQKPPLLANTERERTDLGFEWDQNLLYEQKKPENQSKRLDLRRRERMGGGASSPSEEEASDDYST